PSVLLVEDDVFVSKLMATLVEEAGYRSVTIAEHGQIADAIDRFDPKCIILDGEIGRSGRSRSWDDAAAIRRAHAALPVLTFSTAIHELKTPLTVISGQLQRARKLTSKDPERGRAAMEIAQQQIERMNRLIAGLQDYLRLKSNAVSLEVATLDLRDAIAAAIT